MYETDKEAEIGLTDPSIRNQYCDEVLGMIMNLISGHAITGEGRDVCIVPVNQYAGLLLLEQWGQKLLWPKCFRFLTCPSIMGIAIQAVDKNYVYTGRDRSFELGQVITIHVRLHGGLKVWLAKGTHSATMTYHGRSQLKCLFDRRT